MSVKDKPMLSGHVRKVRPRATKRQRAVLRFICATIDTSGFSPTRAEIGRELGISSTNGVEDHIRRLLRDGWLECPKRGVARGLRPLYYPCGAPFLSRQELWDAVREAQGLP